MSYLGSVPPVDDVMVHSRVASLGTRSIKKGSKMAALRLILNMIDLTTLEGKDTPGKVKQLCSKAMRPDPTRDDLPTTAAICVYPAMVPVAAEALAGSGVHLAAVATYFPSGQAPTSMRLDDVAQTVKAGADEIDMVIDRGAFLAGDYLKVFEDVVAVKEACGDAHLKVILEVGELGTYDNVRKASMLAMAAGPDFIKTSTGKISPASTREVTLVMLEAIRDYQDMTGIKMGMKPAGGIRTSKDAIKYLVMLQETLGPDWMTNEKFRFGASSLANDVLMQIRWLETGRYQSSDYFTKD
jgi:deoxyribose-phosphate aldolase